VSEQGVDRAVDCFAAGRAQPDLHTAAVGRVGRTLHQPAYDEAVDPICHRPAGDERLVDELARRQLIGLAGAAQSREDVEFPGVQLVAGKGLFAGPVKVMRKARDPAQDMHGRNIHIGSFPAPCGDQSINFVLSHTGILRFKILDIEMICTGRIRVGDMEISEVVAAGPSTQRELLAHGDITSRRLVEATLESLTRTQERLNTCVALYDTSALDAADEADRQRAAGQAAPLLGVPIAVNDDTDIAGDVTGWGSSAMTRPAGADAELMTRIREAGMILVAKTTLPELAIFGFTESERYGITRNPYNRAHTPGGSSGGSAASVADGAVGIATGSDGAGCIRIPAACCGLVGFKPTQGTMPSSGGWHDLSTQGCLTRKVIDSALYLDTFGTFESSLEKASQADPAPLRIGIDLHPFPASVPLKNVDPRVVAAVAGAGDVFAALGHDVRTVRVRYGTAAQAMTVRFLAGVRDGAAGADDPTKLERRSRQIAWLGKPFSAKAIARSREAGRRLGETLLDDLGIDILLTPTMSGPAVEVGRWEGKGGLATVLGMRRFYAFTSAWNHTGQPAVSLPAGFTEEEGLPLAIQLVAARGDDARLMALAGQYERAQDEKTPS